MIGRNFSVTSIPSSMNFSEFVKDSICQYPSTSCDTLFIVYFNRTKETRIRLELLEDNFAFIIRVSILSMNLINSREFLRL